MADLVDFSEEAKRCLRFAEAETDPQLKTILMGMVVGWLMLARQPNSSAALQDKPAEELV